MGPATSYFVQIGDGAIILGNDTLYGVVFWPQSGEYANTTNFLTSDEYAKQLEFLATPSKCSKVALMTDGIERLALRFDIQTPHIPFFDPLFRALTFHRRRRQPERRFAGVLGFQFRSASIRR